MELLTQRWLPCCYLVNWWFDITATSRNHPEKWMNAENASDIQLILNYLLALKGLCQNRFLAQNILLTNYINLKNGHKFRKYWSQTRIKSWRNWIFLVNSYITLPMNDSTAPGIILSKLQDKLQMLTSSFTYSLANSPPALLFGLIYILECFFTPIFQSKYCYPFKFLKKLCDVTERY